MKLAWVVDAPLDRRTGGTIYDAFVVEGLRARGVDVDVHYPTARASELVRTLARRDYDVIVGDELCHPTLHFVFERLRKPRRTLLVHHLTSWEMELAHGARARARYAESRLLHHVDDIVTTSATTRDRLLVEGCRVPITVIRPGADRLPLHPRSPVETPTIVFAGTITSRKRVLELVRAFAETAPPARLLLLGKRERDALYTRAVDAALVELGLEPRVDSAGEVDEDTLAQALARADALVLPSSLEGYGIVATEAIRAGAPVIAAGTPGLREALRAAEDATIWFDDVRDLGAVLRSFSDDRARRARMAAAAKHIAPAMPSWSACVVAFHAALVA